LLVIAAKATIHLNLGFEVQSEIKVDPGFRRDDEHEKSGRKTPSTPRQGTSK
jgi:hypothetical protein